MSMMSVLDSFCWSNAVCECGCGRECGCVHASVRVCMREYVCMCVFVHLNEDIKLMYFQYLSLPEKDNVALKVANLSKEDHIILEELGGLVDDTRKVCMYCMLSNEGKGMSSSDGKLS